MADEAWWARSDDMSYADKSYWDVRYRKQLGSKPAATQQGVAAQGTGNAGVPETAHAAGQHAAMQEQDDQCFDFDWLCEYGHIRPLLMYLLNPGGQVSADTGGSLDELLHMLASRHMQDRQEAGCGECRHGRQCGCRWSMGSCPAGWWGDKLHAAVAWRHG